MRFFKSDEEKRNLNFFTKKSWFRLCDIKCLIFLLIYSDIIEKKRKKGNIFFNRYSTMRDRIEKDEKNQIKKL